MSDKLNVVVSTVIPTFRRPGELEECIRSVLAQDVAGEIWVVDDSPERSAEVVIDRLGDSRVNYLFMPKPTGGRPSLVRNHGLSSVRGEFIHFLDDDDIVPRGHYQRAVAALRDNPRLGAVFGRAAPFGTNDAALRHEYGYFKAAAKRARICQRHGPIAFAAMQSFTTTMLVCSAGMLRRSSVEAVNGFDPEVRLVEDADLYARVFQRYPAAFLDTVSAHYRIGPSLMHTGANAGIIGRSYQHMHRRYRQELGAAHFFALKILARTVLRCP